MAATQTTTDATILPPSRAVRPMIIAAIGAVAVGLLTRRRELVRGGVRLGAVQLAATMIDAVVHRIETPQGDVPAPPPMVVEAMATWFAETLVAAAFDRLDPPIEHVRKTSLNAA